MPGNDRLFQLLSELDDAELKNIWTTCLGKEPEDDYFEPGSKDHKVIVISKEWRAVHGHTLLNRFRNDHDLPWKQILIDVADKMKPGFGWTDFKLDDEHTEEEIETAILGFFDELVKLQWEKLSEEDRQKMVNNINDSLDHTAEVIRAKGNRAGFAPVTVSSLSSGIGAGLLAGGGALLVAQTAASGVVGGLLGGVLYQIGLWIVVRIFGWWSGAQLVSGGGAAVIGGVLVSAPALIAFIANALMSTSYRKTIPATLSLLCAHEMRKQLAELEKTQ
jgi:uncharacterized protein YaaW (UPF0174 family)